MSGMCEVTVARLDGRQVRGRMPRGRKPERGDVLETCKLDDGETIKARVSAVTREEPPKGPAGLGVWYVDAVEID